MEETLALPVVRNLPQQSTPQDATATLLSALSHKEDQFQLKVDVTEQHSAPVTGPTPPAHYPEGTRVEIVKGGARFLHEDLKKSMSEHMATTKPDFTLRWHDKPVTMNAHGTVVAHGPHPSNDVIVHVVELDVGRYGKHSHVLIHPNGLAPALWKGQDVYVSRDGARYDPQEGFTEMFPSIAEEDWVPIDASCEKRKGKLLTLVHHPEREGVACYVVKLEKVAKPQAVLKGEEKKEEEVVDTAPAPAYVILQGYGLRDQRVLPAYMRQRNAPRTEGRDDRGIPEPRERDYPRNDERDEGGKGGGGKGGGMPHHDRRHSRDNFRGGDRHGGDRSGGRYGGMRDREPEWDRDGRERRGRDGYEVCFAFFSLFYTSVA